MICRMWCGLAEWEMMVATPAPVASSAAMIFVSIPPVPSEEPSVAVDTVKQPKVTTNAKLGKTNVLTHFSNGFYTPNYSHRPSIRALAWIIGIQAIDIGEQE